MTQRKPWMNLKGINRRELHIGLNMELEHTQSKNRARNIALDHLRQFPNYYSNLVRMERRMKRR